MLTLVGVLLAAAGPRLGVVRSGQNVRSARVELAAVVDAARGAAIQRGRPARFILRGDTALAIVDDGSVGGFQVVRTAALGAMYKVDIAPRTTADSVVTFDGRGLARPRLGRIARFVISSTRTVQRDSVCVSSLGLLLPRECTL